MEEPLTVFTAATRRGLLRRSLALAVMAPALASTLHVGTAFADDGDNDKDDKKPKNPPPPRGQHVNSFSSDLSTVAQSAASGDFTSGNAGTDPLTDGRIRLGRRGRDANEGRLQVDLRGAAANVSYDVLFWPATSSKGRESLGTIGPTNKDGNLNAVTPSALSGMNRVGVFVIVRHDGNEGGKDEFISSMGG
jgi:hypothetical protein